MLDFDPRTLPRDVLLTRQQGAKALTMLGYRISAATLETMAVRGGGPPYRKWGRAVRIVWGDALDWAQARLSEPKANSAALTKAERVQHETERAMRGAREREQAKALTSEASPHSAA
jgi:hypothetical protein